MSVAEAHDFFRGLDLSSAQAEVAKLVLEEIRSRLGYLVEVGLGYLTLDRQSRTLSGGELERVDLTTAIGSSLVNTLYILDEPSIGLHARDSSRLVGILKKLRDNGNTVVVVEHDAEVIRCERSRDRSRAGRRRARRRGAVRRPHRRSPRLPGIAHRRLPVRATGDRRAGRRAAATTGSRLRVRRARANNLKSIDCEIPLGTLTCITGRVGFRESRRSSRRSSTAG